MVEGISCPRCGSENVARILYGMPAFDDELAEKVEAGDIVLAGCCIEPGGSMPAFSCLDCGLRFDVEDPLPTAREFFDSEDLAFLENLSLPVSEGVVPDDYVPFTKSWLLALRCSQLARALLSDDPAQFVRLLESGGEITCTSYRDQTFCRLVELGLNFGVAREDGACANYLGALYYTGDVVEQDYQRAKELYELAESKGNVQATINLGYIYEYGRTGQPDHQKAYQQYAKAAALYAAPEALYKLGDMYSRAKVVKRDLPTAYQLYLRSLENAAEITLKAQAAVRIANLVSNDENQRWGIPFNPMFALEMYQLAERGLRIDISLGNTYYQKRLAEALDGQERVRMILDPPSFK